MSESLSASDMEALQARDTRFRVLAEAIAIETELRDSPTIRALMDAVRLDAEQAMDEIILISPADQEQIAFHQVKIRTFRYIRQVLDLILRRGAVAEQDIRLEDGL